MQRQWAVSIEGLSRTARGLLQSLESSLIRIVRQSRVTDPLTAPKLVNVTGHVGCWPAVTESSKINSAYKK